MKFVSENMWYDIVVDNNNIPLYVKFSYQDGDVETYRRMEIKRDQSYSVIDSIKYEIERIIDPDLDHES